MHELIVNIANSWHNYYRLKHISKEHQTDKLINEHLVTKLKAINELHGFPKMLVDSSSGEGNITRAPWIASFDTKVTRSATTGFYVVFLFSNDMERLVLELGLGATQFTRFYGKNNIALSKIHDAAKVMRSYSQKLLDNSFTDDFLNKLSSTASNITDITGYSLQRGYEEGSIFHIEYEIANLPDEKILIKDYIQFLKLYQLLVKDGQAPSDIELLSLSLPEERPPEKPTITEVVDFQPRKPKNRPLRNTSNNQGGQKSKRTKAIGDWGEKLVLNHEIAFLKSNGRSDLALKVTHEEAEGNRPGWDISSFDLQGNQRRIEVKSSISKYMNGLNLTANELSAAEKHGDSYFLYLVTGVKKGGAKRIEVLKNPHALIKNSIIQHKPVLFEVKLFPPDD